MVVAIALTRGQVALVDDEDAYLAGFRWYARPIDSRPGGFYAQRGVQGRTIYMHREVLRAPAGLLVDHISGDGLDNRRSNLRLATRSQNNTNRRAAGGSGYRGVYPDKKRWRARIEARGARSELGSFPTPEDAARAYDAAAKAAYGDFARLNFPASEAGR